MVDICPLPLAWHRVYQALTLFADRHGASPPPAPLILGGWVWSSDSDKLERWQQMIRWAEANGCSDLLAGVAPHEMHRAPYLSSYRLGDEQEHWNRMPRTKFPQEQVAAWLDDLRARWADVAGSELAAVTSPLGFTGTKARRLLVWADPAATAPWGTWTSLDPKADKRQVFTRLRAAVNALLDPHAVDQIDFVHESTSCAR